MGSSPAARTLFVPREILLPVYSPQDDGSVVVGNRATGLTRLRNQAAVLGGTVIFGYLGFLILSGWYTRSFGSILLSVVVTLVWGSLILGVVPGTPGISWQAHLGGFLGGVVAARGFRTSRRSLVERSL